MNILPLILAFLLVFGGIALTFLRESKSFWIMESSLASLERTERAVNNRLAQRAYLTHRGDPLVKREGEKEPPKTRFQCRRALFPPLEESKFNLQALFAHEGPVQLLPLYESLAEYLRALYQKNLFSAHHYPEKIEYKILDALLAKGHALKVVHSFSELYPEDPKLQKLFYKMLKGTTLQNEKGGYPAFEDCFSLREKEAAICICFATPQILEVLFDKKMADLILEEEKKKWAKEGKNLPISKEELQALLFSNPVHAATLSSIESYLGYSAHSAARKVVWGKDRRTGITAQKELQTRAATK